MKFLLKKLIFIVGKISGNDVLGELSQLKRTIRLSESELEINCKNRLIAVLDYARKNSKFYKESLKNINLDNFSFTEFKKLPILICFIFIYLLIIGFIKGHKTYFKSITFILYFIGIFTTFHAATRTFVSPLFIPLVGLNELKITKKREQ